MNASETVATAGPVPTPDTEVEAKSGCLYYIYIYICRAYGSVRLIDDPPILQKKNIVISPCRPRPSQSDKIRICVGLPLSCFVDHSAPCSPPVASSRWPAANHSPASQFKPICSLRNGRNLAIFFSPIFGLVVDFFLSDIRSIL